MTAGCGELFGKASPPNENGWLNNEGQRARSHGMSGESSGHGQLFDTYSAALQHGLIEVSEDALLVGVVRRPMPWLLGQVDENRRALGPSADLLDEFAEECERLQARGMADAEAHNAAAEAVDFASRYREYLRRDDGAQEALDAVVSMVEDGTAVGLVCYENTDEKRCHRTTLKAVLEERLN